MKKKFSIKIFEKEIDVSNNIIEFAKLRNKLFKICFDKSNELRNRYYEIRNITNFSDHNMLDKYREIASGFVQKYNEIYYEAYSLLLNEYNCNDLNYDDLYQKVKEISNIVDKNISAIIQNKKYDGSNVLNNMNDEFIDGAIKSTVLSSSGSPLLGSASATMASININAELERFIYSSNQDFVAGYDVAIEAYVDMSYDLSLYLSMFCYSLIDVNSSKKLMEKGCNITSALHEFEKYKVLDNKDKKINELISSFELNMFDSNIIKEILSLNTSSNTDLVKWLLFINNYNPLNYFTDFEYVNEKFSNGNKDLKEYFYKDVYNILKDEYDEERIVLCIYSFISNQIVENLNFIYDFSLDDVTIYLENIKNQICLLESLFSKLYLEKYVIYHNMNIYDALKEYEKLKKGALRFSKLFSWYWKLIFGGLVFVLNMFMFLPNATLFAYIFPIIVDFIYIYKLIKTKIWFKNFSMNSYRDMKIRKNK